jgi:outer membrane protein assembly factor BamB
MKLRALIPFAALTFTATAADWPQYRGPNGDGSTPEALPAKWPAAPKVLWKTPGGTGFSSFIVSGAWCFTVEGLDGKEVLVARNVADGKVAWKHEIGTADYGHQGGNDGTANNKGGDGPRSTPTLAGNLIITTNADLVVQAHDGVTGKPVWKRDIIAEHKGRNITWKNAASPLIEGGLIYVAGGGPGESFLALDPKTGAVVAKSGDDTITHATPTAATIHGQRQIIFFMKSGLTSVDPKTLKQLWHADFPFSVSTAASPVVAGDYVYCSAGYGVGAAGFKISKTGSDWKAEQVMRVPQKPLANHWSTPVLFNGHLYGMFQFKEYGKGPVKAVKLPDGDVKWEKEGFGPGHVVLTAGGGLLALSDAGELVGITASPDGYKELGRIKVLDGKCWTTPVLSNGRVFVRSTKEAACIQLGTSK